MDSEVTEELKPYKLRRRKCDPQKSDPRESDRQEWPVNPVKDIEENNENDEADTEDLLEDDPFPFFFDGRGIGKGTQTKLEKFLTSFLTRWDWLAVEKNIATFDMSNSGRGFTFSLREVYYLGIEEDISANRKRQGDSLISPRRNKIARQIASFSDEDED